MEPRDGTHRYLIHFSDGGAGMRYRDQPLELGERLQDAGSYRIDRVEHPSTA